MVWCRIAMLVCEEAPCRSSYVQNTGKKYLVLFPRDLGFKPFVVYNVVPTVILIAAKGDRESMSACSTFHAPSNLQRHGTERKCHAAFSCSSGISSLLAIPLLINTENRKAGL